MHRHVARSGRASYIRRACASGVVALLGACGGGTTVAPPDAGMTPGPCAGDLFCDGITLRACTAEGKPGPERADCTPEGACSLNRCTSLACADAERNRKSFVGCTFYTAQVDNVASERGAATSFLVTNPGAEPARVELWRRVSGSWTSAGADTAAPGQAVRLTIGGLEIEEAGWTADDGLRVTSSQPVSVAQIQSDDRNHDALSSGGTMLLPVQTLGRHHLVMAYPQRETPALAATANHMGGAGRLVVVGTAAHTSVDLKLPAGATLVVAGVLAGVSSGSTYQVRDLGDGEIFQAWSGGDTEDLSGTEISADQPIAVFSGNISTTYGKVGAVNTISSPDMAHEQIPPISHWSYKYVAAALPPQVDTCDTLLGVPGASLWRLLAASADTEVEFTGPDPTRPVHETVIMGAGTTIELVAGSDFVVTATKPLLLTQGIDCEPSLSLGISADRLLDDVTFSVLPAFDQMVAIARKANETVLLDGAPVSNALFVPAGDGYEVARVSLTESGRACPPSQQVCTHRLQGRFGMTLRGMDVLASYALTMPAWAGCIDPLEPTCID